MMQSTELLLLLELYALVLSVDGEEPYYNVCINFAGLNQDYKNCLYAAPHPQVSTSRDIIYSEEVLQTVNQWCSITSPWQRDCFKTVTSHCDNALALAELVDKTGLCNGTRPTSWINDSVRLFTGLDRTCLSFLPETGPEVAVTASNIETFKTMQEENFSAYLVEIWFQSMASNCHKKAELFYYRMISDLMSSDLGVNYIDETSIGFSDWF